MSSSRRRCASPLLIQCNAIEYYSSTSSKVPHLHHNVVAGERSGKRTDPRIAGLRWEPSLKLPPTIYQYLNDHVSRNTCMIKAVQMISGENQRSTSRGRHQGCECNLPIHYRDVAPCTWPIRQLRSDVVLYCIRHLTARQRTGICFMETFDVVPSPDEY